MRNVDKRRGGEQNQEQQQHHNGHLTAEWLGKDFNTSLNWKGSHTLLSPYLVCGVGVRCLFSNLYSHE